jgi:hypothetical protein
MGWNLPPGVTQKMLDDHLDGDGFGPCECDDIRRDARRSLEREGVDSDDADAQVERESADGDMTCGACRCRRED